jgi:hypothetical protein
MRHLFRRLPPAHERQAEPFIQTLANRWAYGAIYDDYNFRRRLGSLGDRPPAARIAELEHRGGYYR